MRRTNSWNWNKHYQMSKRPAEGLGGPNYIELREHDEESLRTYLRRKPDNHHCNDVLRKAGLRDFLLMPILAYDVSLVAKTVRLIALHPSTLEIFEPAIQEVTGLPLDTPEVPDGPKQSRKEHPNIPKLLAWAEVYGRGIISEKDVDVMRNQLQKIVDIVTDRIEGDSEKMEEVSA
eukprot:Gb_04332 [translate_table: standard]